MPDVIQTEELDILARAQAVMKNIYDLVIAKGQIADRVAVIQQIQRSLLFDVVSFC